MFTVGVEQRTARATRARSASCAQRSAESSCLAVASRAARRRASSIALSAARDGRAASAKPSIGRVAVGGDQRGERLHEVEGRAVEPRAVARVDVLLRARGPTSRRSRPARSSTTPLAPSDTVTLPSGSCAADGMKTPRSASSAAVHLRPLHDLLEVRRADLLLALGHQHEVDRQLAARAADGVQRGEERGLRPLLVDGAAAHRRPCRSPGLSTSAASHGGDDHSAGIDLLHVVHEVEADRARRARVERREHAGLAVGRARWSTFWKPASRASCIISSQPSVMPRFSAAIVGCFTQFRQRCTLSAWRFMIFRLDRGMRVAHAAGEKRGGLIAAAPAAAAPRKSRRVNSDMPRSLSAGAKGVTERGARGTGLGHENRGGAVASK